VDGLDRLGWQLFKPTDQLVNYRQDFDVADTLAHLVLHPGLDLRAQYEGLRL
jgi:hypothetical protein